MEYKEEVEVTRQWQGEQSITGCDKMAADDAKATKEVDEVVYARWR